MQSVVIERCGFWKSEKGLSFIFGEKEWKRLGSVVIFMPVQTIKRNIERYKELVISEDCPRHGRKARESRTLPRNMLNQTLVFRHPMD